MVDVKVPSPQITPLSDVIVETCTPVLSICMEHDKDAFTCILLVPAYASSENAIRANDKVRFWEMDKFAGDTEPPLACWTPLSGTTMQAFICFFGLFQKVLDSLCIIDIIFRFTVHHQGSNLNGKRRTCSNAFTVDSRRAGTCCLVTT